MQADNLNKMTYQKIFEMKFRKGYSTTELIQRFPKEAEKVREIALLQLPNSLLKKTLSDNTLLARILSLKRKFLPGWN